MLSDGWYHRFVGAVSHTRGDVVLVLRHPGRAGLVGRLLGGRATASSFAEQAAAYGLADRHKLAEIAAASRRWRRWPTTAGSG